MKNFRPNLKSADTFGAREPKRPHRSYVDNEYITRGYMAIFPHSVTVFYLALAKYANSKTQFCYPSSETLMKLAGMKNKNTFHRDMKLLIHYRIVRVISGSKGRVPNVYQLLSYTLWKEINSSDFDTVINSLKSKTTVSKEKPQQYQKDPSNSDTDDTGNHISNSDKKITSKFSIKGKATLERLLPSTALAVKTHFKEEDVIKTLEEIGVSGESNLVNTKTIIKALTEKGCLPIVPLPSYMRYG